MTRCRCHCVQDRYANVQECPLFINRKILLAAEEETVPGCTSPTPASTITAYAVLIPATQSDLAGHLLIQHPFLEQLLQARHRAGEAVTMSALERLLLQISRIEDFWIGTKGNVMWLSASIFTRSFWCQSHLVWKAETIDSNSSSPSPHFLA